MDIIKCQGWQCFLLYFERQTMYHEYIKMSSHEYTKMSKLAMPVSIH
jgi:hypothetical protein